MRPAAVRCVDVTRGPHLSHCSISVSVGTRLLIVSEPHDSASSLLRVLAGLSRPHRGSIEIAGLSEGWERRVAYIGQEPAIYAWMTPREVVNLAAGLLGLHGGDARRSADLALDWARVPHELSDRPMSRGGASVFQRVALAAALIGKPEVLLLDEPLRALDEAERTRMLTIPEPRRTVLIASRYPASDAALASHVALLRDGRVAMLAATAELRDAGLPLSLSGIGELADRRAGSSRRAGSVAAVS